MGLDEMRNGISLIGSADRHFSLIMVDAAVPRGICAASHSVPELTWSRSIKINERAALRLLATSLS
jgi:hypothetical protein